MTVLQHDTPSCRCTNCGEILNAATGVNDRKPNPGDATLCFYCGHFMVFDADLKTRNPTDAEIRKWAGNEELVCASNIVAEFKP